MTTDKESSDSIAGHVEQLDAVNTTQRHFFQEFAEKSEEWRKEQDTKLVRKVDLHLFPFLVTMYLLNFLDRSNLAQARQGSLEKDLKMKNDDFNLATSIFFVGYLLMQLPSNLLITRLRPSLYLSACVILWGVVSTCNAAAHNFTHLVVIRFFLGFAEAPFFPGAIFLMSSWYTRAELTRRLAWFYTGTPLANMFGGMIAYGVLKDLDGAHGIAGWRWLFIVEGVTTIGFALIAVYFLPDYPATTRWLSEEERAFAAWRLLEDVNETDDPKANTVWSGVVAAFKDYRLYLFVLLQHLGVLAMTFQYFFPSIIETLKVTKLKSLLLTIPPWFATFVVSVTVNWTAAKTNDRYIHIGGLMLLSAIGNAVATACKSFGPRYFAMFLMPIGAVSAYTIIVGWVSISFPRPLVKRSAAIAVANMVGNLSSVYGSYMYSKKDAPQYVPGASANAIICLLTAAMAILMKYVHVWENKKLERKEQEAAADGEPAPRDGFRYIY